ncbi:alpha/beta hydrolase [Rhizobium bangladeshense]|nr:alpha/beta hydrolase [Rhizobium bangladeshense]MBY3599286.1 alpha/beta hydrolase [Rhizobium bangladeshense]
MMKTENRLLSVVEHWLPRIEVAGIPSPTARAIIDRAGVWERWLQAWVEEGDLHAELGEQALQAGRRITAGEAFARASLLYHFGQFMAFDDLSAKQEVARKKVETFARAIPLLDPPGNAIAIPYEGGTLKAILRYPKAEGSLPVAIIIPGSDSTKEEFPAFEKHFLARGIATLSLDGPGQGEGREFGPLQPDISRAVQAAVDHLSSDESLNGQRGLIGMAFGGHLALRAAAIGGFTAVVSINGFFDLGDFWPDLPQVYHDNMRFSLGGDDTLERAKRFTLRETPHLDIPALILHGGRDKIFPPSEAERCMAIAGPGSVLEIFPEGNHVCNNISWKYRPLVADWLSEQFQHPL